MTMAVSRTVLLIAGSLLAGCSPAKQLTEPSHVAGDKSATEPVSLVPVTPATPRSPLIGQALLLLPDEAAPVKTVRERHFPNGTRQEVVLDTARHGAGEGVIDVSMQTAAAREGRSTDLQLYKPTEDNIRNEIIGRFPDVKMNLVTRSYSNGYGPVGIAVGRHPSGAACVFAWQWIDNLRSANAGSSGFDRFGAAISGSGNPTSVRIRLCRRDQTADQLVAHIEQLKPGNPDAFRRLVQMDRSRADGTVQVNGKAGETTAPGGVLRPVEGSLESMLPKSSQPQPTAVSQTPSRAAPRVPRRVVREQDWRNQPAYTERATRWERQQPSVNTEGGRRFLAPVQPAQGQVSPGQFTPSQVTPGYVVPGQVAHGQAAPRTIIPAQIVPAAPAGRSGADLPLEAFRGPATQPSRLPSR